MTGGPGAGGQPGDSGESREPLNEIQPVDPGAADTPLNPPASPPDSVFWGYAELFLFTVLAVPAMLAGFGLVRAVLAVFRLHPIRAAGVMMEQFVGYFFLFLILVVIFRFQYGRPFWESLGWKPFRTPPILLVAGGWLTALAVLGIGVLIRTPSTENALAELMQDRISILIVGAFGITLGPLAEELAFRGFVQPLLVKSFGAAAGIVLSSLPFGVLHFAQYGNSWRHVLLITAAGSAFGLMRHRTGSTKAATLMHSAYNAFFFASLWHSKQPS